MNYIYLTTEQTLFGLRIDIQVEKLFNFCCDGGFAAGALGLNFCHANSLTFFQNNLKIWGGVFRAPADGETDNRLHYTTFDAGDGSSLRGSEKQIRAPLPICVSTQIFPPWDSTMALVR